MSTNSENRLSGPALLADNLVENVWGGDWIARWKGLSSDGKKIGESWEFSAHADHPGSVFLPDGKKAAVGPLLTSRSGGLLLKFIDASGNLSLQVHPTDAYAKAHEKSPGKSESWLVLEVGKTAEEGFIYLGFDPQKRRGFETVEAFAAAFLKACRAGQEKEVLSFVNKIRVKPNEAFHVPPGTIHALGRGVRLFEVQQSSGLTYRVWDWNRGTRELHLDKAAQVIDFSAEVLRVEEPQRLVDPLGHYEAETLTVDSEIKIKPAAVFSVLTVLSGEMRVDPGLKNVRAGHSVFVPENIPVNLNSAGKNRLRVIRSWPTGPRLFSAAQ